MNALRWLVLTGLSLAVQCLALVGWLCGLSWMAPVVLVATLSAWGATWEAVAALTDGQP